MSTSTHPMYLAAAGAVVITCGVAVASMTGLLPDSKAEVNQHVAGSEASTTTLASPAADANINGVSAQPQLATNAVDQPVTAPKKVAAPAPKPAAPKPDYTAYTPVSTNSGYRTARSQPAAICYECGTVSAVNVVQTPGQGSGMGAVAGGVVGGAIGNQMGGGNGKKAMTVLGVIGGAFLGNQIEKNYKTAAEYEVVVAYDQGGTNSFRYQQAPTWQPGDRVKVVNGQITRTY